MEKQLKKIRLPLKDLTGLYARWCNKDKLALSKEEEKELEKLIEEQLFKLLPLFQGILEVADKNRG